MHKHIPITAYSHTPGTYHNELTEVGRGTPMGELLRRYWHPIGLTADASDLPKAVRALGEDLVLFRDQLGRPGLVYPRCVHRGSSLLYGRVDEAGIRCCYHGWSFDVEGRCTDQPCEPQNGMHRDKVRQPWYPLQERYGLIWAYMGPPDKQPLLPRYSALEPLDDGEQLFTDDKNIGSGRHQGGTVPFNFLQHFENIHDPGHFLWLHHFHSGPQFGSRYGELDKLDFHPWQRMADIKFKVSPRGVGSDRTQVLPDGRSLRTVVETVLPVVRGVPNPFAKPGRLDTLGFVLPVDDTSFRIFTVLRAPSDDFFRRIAALQSSRDAQRQDLPEFSQRFPGDWEAQGSQGPITLHTEEHLGTSDRGIVMLRRLLKQQIEVVKAGGDPINLHYQPGSEWVELEAGQYVSETATADTKEH